MDRSGSNMSSLWLRCIIVLYVFCSLHLECLLGHTTLPRKIWTDSDGCKDGNETNCSGCQPSAPFPLAIGAYNITLSWEPLDHSDVVYIPQWTGPSLSGVWTWKENTTAPPFTVATLQPYSWYKFRIWAVVCQDPISSPESPLYQTEAYGAPSSPPVIESIESSSESVELSWSAPAHPGGPIVGYNLNLTSLNATIVVTTGGSELSTTVFPTAANTTYRVSLAAVNRDGQGPAAQTSITTPEQEEQSVSRWVIVSRLESLRKKAAENFYFPADCLSDGRIKSNITGVSIHQSSGQVYFSEGVHIWTKGASNFSDHSDLRLLYSSSQEVKGLSVDWLYEKLYFISGGKVFCCGLKNCSDPVQLQLPTTGPPTRVKADPYNGWLFLLLHDGIYRAVLPDDSGDHSQNMSMVLNSTSLHDFVVSVQNKRLVYFQDEITALSSVSLDGSSPVILRSDVTVVDTVQSLAYEHNQFILTNGLNLYQEERRDDLIRFNYYLMDCDFSDFASGGFEHLHYSSPSSQAYPVPHRPRDLTALFGSSRALLRWREPQRRMGTSPSAWQKWTYTVSVSRNGSVVRAYGNITMTQMEVTDLKSSQRYTLSVRAESPGGQSTSVLFEGTTLQDDSNIPYIVAASNDRLWRQDMDDYDFSESLAYNIATVRDMDWYNGTVYWTDSSGRIRYMALKDGASGVSSPAVPGAVGAGVVAFEWLGKQLYWNCNLTQICRGHPASAEQEVVVRSGRNITGLAVDPMRAFVYWSTPHSVQRARLDGLDRHTIQELSVFLGWQVAAMTLDLRAGFLFWLVQDGLQLHLFKTELLQNRLPITQTLRWSSSVVSGSELAVYSGRLLWLDVDQRLRLQEVNKTESVVMSPDHRLTAFTLIQSTLKPLPDGFVLPPVVIPEAVPETSVRVVGNTTSFRIIWEPSSNVNYGTVFYCVESAILQLPITEQEKQNSIGGFCPPSNRLKEPILEVRHLPPDTPFRLAITPYTYWGAGDTISKDLRSPGKESSREGNVVIIVFSVLTVVLLAVIITAVFIWFKRRRTEKQNPLPRPPMEPQSPDEELEEIRGLVGMANACYAVRTLPSHREIGTLPVFPREQLKLQRLLGSGAFGEVYEGIATGIPSNLRSETRVAVKTLMKGATDDEKNDFLKEAHLMSQFNHPNILSLLGVCLQNEPQFLILELMEGGDLRSYLMGARPGPKCGARLKFCDLMDICLDVAKGCAYLERMHFVHRDLAARNCLVSVKSYTDPERVVKIGDFGLSRDIYKNDYYRKKGEGLLPVRWMSPESLSDGIFNKYSDVWAFGVLLWEVVTLGKQPYPAFTNMEVLHHINSGGRLQVPDGCPETLYTLMLGCWAKNPSDRPDFGCLEKQIGQLRQMADQLGEEQDRSRGIVNYGFREDEDCSVVDEDESPGEGLTHVVSEEGLNYLMFSVNDRECETAPVSDQESMASDSGVETQTSSQDTTESSSGEGIIYLNLSAKDLLQTINKSHSLELSNGEGAG